MGQPIFSTFFTDATLYAARKSMGVTKKLDCVSQGYKPTGNNADGVLMEIKSSPLAYYDYPTLNQMIFRGKLWQNLLSDSAFTTRMRLSSSFWGENGHADSLEIKIPLISNKVTDFWLSEDKNNMILGNIQVLDTPQGNIVYSLLKSGDMGISSRGWGDLVAINSGSYPEFQNSEFYSKPEMKVVNEDGYIATSFDFVTVPAVGPAMVSIRAHLDRFADVKNAVVSSLNHHPVADYSRLQEILKPSREVGRRVFSMAVDKVQPTYDAKTPAREPIDEESNGDNGEAFTFKRGTAAVKPGSPSMAMGKNGWSPITVKAMGTRRKRDITIPHRPEGNSGVDEEFHSESTPPKQVERDKQRPLLQAKDSSAMTMERLPEDDQRNLFDRMVGVELARAIELRNSQEEGFGEEDFDMGDLAGDDFEGEGFDDPQVLTEENQY